MKKELCVVSGIFLLVSSLSGCASIVSKSNWPVTVQSNPAGAKCLISKSGGAQLHSGETPMTVNLSAKKGYFSPASYTIECVKEGYQKSSTEVYAGLNGWYLGNIIFGGLIGMLIVDPVTGAMWSLDETQMVSLAPINAMTKTEDTKQQMNVEKSQVTQATVADNKQKPDVDESQTTKAN
jgi:hypothetical protein